MVEGLSWEGSYCSQGSRRIAGFEAHLLWSVLISFGFLSFCGIKVLLLLRLSLCLSGVAGIHEPKQWERGRFSWSSVRAGAGSGVEVPGYMGKDMVPSLKQQI